jgi:hypothetical protein
VVEGCAIIVAVAQPIGDDEALCDLPSRVVTIQELDCVFGKLDIHVISPISIVCEKP